MLIFCFYIKASILIFSYVLVFSLNIYPLEYYFTFVIHNIIRSIIGDDKKNE